MEGLTKKEILKRVEKIEDVISDIMINDGPDGHCDGSDVIACYVEALIDGKGDKWEKEYFNKGKERWMTDVDS